MIHDLWLRWLVTVFSLLSAAEWVNVIVARRRRWTFVVSYALHLVMALAMAVMAWPFGAHLPTTGLAVFFLFAAGWFVAVTMMWARTPAQRVLRSYHALMMLAMAWMFATMGRQAEAPSMSMPGMDMGPTAGSGPPGWVTAGNWFWFAGFAVATLVWAYLVVAERGKPLNKQRRLYGTGQALMAAGMAITFAGMLFQL